MRDLLPPNATELEKALDAVENRITALSVPLERLWNPQTCPEVALPFLAWALSVDLWDAGWSLDARREAVVQALGLHRIKGTVASVRNLLTAVGYGDVEIVEGLAAGFYDGRHRYDGMVFYGDDDTLWARYRVILKRPISIAQAAQVRRLLELTAPQRARLEGLHFEQALNLYDQKISYDNSFTHGVA